MICLVERKKNNKKKGKPGNAINLILIARSYLMFEQEEHKLVETVSGVTEK